jgi:hypothetical protein
MLKTVVTQRYRVDFRPSVQRLSLRGLWWLGRLRRRVVQGPTDRGDVPGWVLVTIMTAGLVVALWAIAGPKLGQLFSNAVDSVKGP